MVTSGATFFTPITHDSKSWALEKQYSQSLPCYPVSAAQAISATNTQVYTLPFLLSWTVCVGWVEIVFLPKAKLQPKTPTFISQATPSTRTHRYLAIYFLQ